MAARISLLRCSDRRGRFSSKSCSAVTHTFSSRRLLPAAASLENSPWRVACCFVSRADFSLLSLVFPLAYYCLSLTHTVLPPPPPPLSLTLHHVLFSTTHGLSRHLLPQSHRRLSSPTKKKKKKACSTNRQRLPAPRMFSFPKEKKRKEQPKLHDLAFLLILRTLLQPALFFNSCSARSCPFAPLPSKLLSFFTNKIKIKKNAALLEKVLICAPRKFSFQKKNKETKLDDLDLTFLLTLKELQPAFFFCRCSARSARSSPSGRFSLLLASRCRFKILLQYPWKLQLLAYKKPNLAAVCPGPY